jgi:hypothetical protein
VEADKQGKSNPQFARRMTSIRYPRCADI